MNVLFHEDAFVNDVLVIFKKKAPWYSGHGL